MTGEIIQIEVGKCCEKVFIPITLPHAVEVRSKVRSHFDSVERDHRGHAHPICMLGRCDGILLEVGSRAGGTWGRKQFDERKVVGDVIAEG